MDNQLPKQQVATVPPTSKEQQQGCGCGGQQQNAAALAERIKGRASKVYKTRFKVF